LASGGRSGFPCVADWVRAGLDLRLPDSGAETGVYDCENAIFISAEYKRLNILTIKLQMAS
jgi:hypothetical protein